MASRPGPYPTIRSDQSSLKSRSAQALHAKLMQHGVRVDPLGCGQTGHSTKKRIHNAVDPLSPPSAPCTLLWNLKICYPPMPFRPHGSSNTRQKLLQLGFIEAVQKEGSGNEVIGIDSQPDLVDILVEPSNAIAGNSSSLQSLLSYLDHLLARVHHRASSGWKTQQKDFKKAPRTFPQQQDLSWLRYSFHVPHPSALKQRSSE